MIYLIALSDKSYAKREMSYTKMFLDHKIGAKVCELITDPKSIPNITENDFAVIADYKSHPAYFNGDITNIAEWDEAISKIDFNRIVVWKGDYRFKCDWPGIKYAIGSYTSVFDDTPDIRWFKNTCVQKITPVVWSMLCPGLEYDYALAETQCYPVNVLNTKKSSRFTFITNGAIKYRLSTLDLLLPINCSMILGNWTKRSEPKVVDFVSNKTNVKYFDDVAYGIDWLNVLSQSEYTIISNYDKVDDFNYNSWLSSRFWESVRANVLPIIDCNKDPGKFIYFGFKNLSEYCMYEDAEHLKYLLENKPKYEECMLELSKFRKLYLGD